MTPHDEIAKLTESLRLTQAELAKARFQLEGLMEESASAADSAARARLLAEATAEGLAKVSTSGDGMRGWVKRRLMRYLANDAETAEIKILEASPLFDAPWYLVNHPDAAATAMTPALHYLREGAAKNLDPGPSFRTRAYKEAHPDLGTENPLLHHLRSGAEG